MLQEVVSGTELSYNYLTISLNIAFEGLHEFLDQGWTAKWEKKQKQKQIKKLFFHENFEEKKFADKTRHLRNLFWERG